MNDIDVVSYCRLVLKNLLPPIVWTTAKKINRNRRKYYGLNSLDKKIEQYLNKNNGYFVELGANDGVTQSNSLYFERHRGWKGLLVEPIPHKYLECLKNRSAESSIFCNACVPFSYKHKFLEVLYSNLMSIPTGLDGDLDDPLNHAKNGIQFLENHEVNFKFGAVARPLNDLLLEADAPRVIDFLSLDVEGAEIQVLKGVDFSQFEFQYMCIESRSPDKLEFFLGQHGYYLVDKLSHHDYLFKHK